MADDHLLENARRYGPDSGPFPVQVVRDDFTWPTADAQDFAILGDHLAHYKLGRGARIVQRFREIERDGVGGFPISRYRHGLLTATLAAQAGKDEEYVVCALLHDFAEPLSWDNHAEIAAKILRPYVSDANHWMIQNHTMFWYQAHLPGEMEGLTPDTRKRFRGHPPLRAHGRIRRAFRHARFRPADRCDVARSVRADGAAPLRQTRGHHSQGNHARCRVSGKQRRRSMPWSDAKTRQERENEHGRLSRRDFSIQNGRSEDYLILGPHIPAFNEGRTARVLALLEMSEEHGMGGFPVSRFEHALQTATLAHRVGKDEEYVVCSLLHDVTEILAFDHHAEIGAELLRPFVSEANYWMLAHHSFFQIYHMGDHLGLPKDMREQWRGHPHFEYTLEFCDRFDAAAFSPALQSMPLEAFKPMVERVFAKVADTRLAAGYDHIERLAAA